VRCGEPNLAPQMHSVRLRDWANHTAVPQKGDMAMKTGQTTLRSFERVARTSGLGTLLVGGLVVIFLLREHDALFNAFRVVGMTSRLIGA
jgi:hypothetical protein